MHFSDHHVSVCLFLLSLPDTLNTDSAMEFAINRPQG
jgi:hypothetical protein